ncbi:MAG: WcaF family extracellular polysaccharide biosynthesis acetyltransferase [Fulvivirga sp.]|nr:WcaF family extracellular polysaccharide biosynthesis acetyltransferase [Fulvivirga sp.]
MKTDLSTYNNDWYNTGATFLKRMLWYFINIVFFINPLIPISSLKIFLLRAFGAKVGVNVGIKPNVNIKYPWLLVIGDNVWIGEKVWIDNLCKVTIGSNVCISQGAMLLTGNHNYSSTSFDLIIGEIKLEDGVWVGAKSIVCPGVTCHSHSVLSVNSVAVDDLDSYKVYQGNPAVFKRKRVMKQ